MYSKSSPEHLICSNGSNMTQSWDTPASHMIILHVNYNSLLRADCNRLIISEEAGQPEARIPLVQPIRWDKRKHGLYIVHPEWWNKSIEQCVSLILSQPAQEYCTYKSLSTNSNKEHFYTLFAADRVSHASSPTVHHLSVTRYTSSSYLTTPVSWFFLSTISWHWQTSVQWSASHPHQQTEAQSSEPSEASRDTRYLPRKSTAMPAIHKGEYYSDDIHSSRLVRTKFPAMR